MEILTNEKEIMQMARDERCSVYTAELLIKDLNQLIAIRKAGEKMAKQLRELRGLQDDLDIDAAAIEAWEAANK